MRRNKVKIKNKQVMCMLATVILQSAVAAFPAQAGELQLFCADGAVDPSYLSQADQVAGKIPESILYALSDAGWRFTVTDKDLADTFFNGLYGAVSGATDPRQSASTLRIAREPLTLLWYMKSVMQQTLSWTWYPILPSLNRYLKKKNTRS